MVKKNRHECTKKDGCFSPAGMLLFFGFDRDAFPQSDPISRHRFAVLFLCYGDRLGVSLEMASVFAVLVTMIEVGAVGFVQEATKAGCSGRSP